MAKWKNELDELKQLMEFMKGHNISKLKTPKFQIEMGRPEDDIDLEKIKSLDENERRWLKEISGGVILCRLSKYDLTEVETIFSKLPDEDRKKLDRMMKVFLRPKA
jgi:hypothetical protein